MVLTNFPRGGKKLEVKKSSHVLFDKKESKKRCKARTKKKTDDEIINIINSTAERLSNTTICEGMTVLGRISEISEYNLIVSIPGGLLGRIEITNLSESYTNLLQNIIDTKSIQSNEFKPLPDLYNLGDYVVCYVKKINLNEQWSYSLSLEPQLINQNIQNSYLVKGAKMVCTVKSREDHGYVVETGIVNVRAFITTDNIDKGKQYFPGNQLLCTIKEIKTTDYVSVVTLSAKRKNSENVSRHDIVSLDPLIPGTKLTLCIKKVLPNGLQVIFGRNNIGYINQIYLDNPLSAYTDNMEVIGTLLYILPTVKLTYFSLLIDTSEKEKLKAGDVIKKAKVLYRESNGIIFELSKSGLRGFISLRRTDVPFAKIATEFKQNSTHKCRVLSYNWMEHLYVCTMEQEILKQKYFSTSDLNFGDILTVTISNIDTNYGCVHVQAGKIKGIVLREHVSDSGLNALSKLKTGDNIEAKVLDISSDKFQKVRFTLKQSLIKSELPVLYDIHEAQCGSKYHGTIVKMNKNGILIKFYGSVKGFVSRNSFNNHADVNWNYFIGQTVTVCIKSVDKNKGKIKLKIVTNEEEKKFDFSIGQLIEGTIRESSIEGIHLILSGDKKHAVTAFLPASHMAPCMEIGSLLASKSNPEDTISAFVFATEPSLILSRTFVAQERYQSFDSLKTGDCIPCTIRDISQDGVRVILPIKNYSKFGFVPYKHISNFELLHVNQILFVKITGINRQKKQLTLTMTLKDVSESSSEYEVQIMSAVDFLHLYLSKLLELAKNTFYENKPISLASLGQKVTGTVEKITKHGLVVQLDNQLIGTVCKDHYNGKIKVGDKVSGVILWKNYIHELVDVSLLPRIVNGISSKQKTLPQLPTEVVLKAEILIITKWYILVLIKRNGSGYLAMLPVRRHANDISPNLTPYVIHDKIRVYVVMTETESNIVPICMLKSALEMPKHAEVKTISGNKKLKRKEKSDQHNAPFKDPAQKDPKKLKTESRKENAANEGDVVNKKGLAIKTENITNESKKIEKELTEKPFSEVKLKDERKRSNKDNKTWKNQDTVIEEENRIKDINENSELDEESSDESEIENKLTEDKSHIPKCGFLWEDTTNPKALAYSETSSDDEEKSEEEPKRKKRKLNATERWEEERQKEREIRLREEALMSNQTPNSIDQFDRLVLSSPNSSLVWLQYMVYHLQATEIDKARAVARRAIKTINFRDETERLNVWNAWLNLESRFGTPESLNDVFQEAVRTNNALKVYTHMLNVHANASRQIELQKLIGTMTSKFKQEPEMWINCGAALLKIGLKEKSRHIMQRALQSLPESQHVNLIVRFANLENKFGDKERAQTLFEQILSSYPKRVDVWSCYVNCLTKSEDIDKARKVLERACVQVLPARKMKTLFNKFKNFEEKYGTPDTVTRVVQMATAYVEKQCNKE